MNRIEPVARVNLAEVETLAFAGGGNRCWWQAGALAHWLESGWRLPERLVGTSAGAAVAAACMTYGPRAALTACEQLYSNNARMFDWAGLARFKLRFAHRRIYPEWVGSFVNAASFDALRRTKTQLRVAITRPARLLGLTGSVVAGTFAYLFDKYGSQALHPRLPTRLGLRQDFVSFNARGTADDARDLLCAAAAAPPIMPARWIDGGPAIDGGYTDSAPIPAQTPQERGRTLVLLTRYYGHLPPLFRRNGRLYWQPSARVPVSTWECLPHTPVRDAFALGERDAAEAFRQGSFVVG